MADLRKLPIYGPETADCDGCELKPQCDKKKVATAYRPERFNGIMIIGEGPGQQEVSQNRPFVGPSGVLLRNVLETSGIDMDECYITNATLCKPPPKQKALHDEFPSAIPSCAGRLEAEIEEVRPTVILTLGAAAWIAISGYDRKGTKLVPFECDDCDVNRKVGPAIQCNARKANPEDGGATSIPCNRAVMLDATCKENVDPEELLAVKEAGCPDCGASLKRMRPKMIKCPTCGGRKRRLEEFTEFVWDYPMTKVAGGIFEPHPGSEAPKAEYHLGAWLGECGVQYVIPSYHPSYLLRGQQFLAKSAQKHAQKAVRLIGGAKPITFEYEVTKDAEVLGKWLQDEWERCEQQGDSFPLLAVDLETFAEQDGKPADARKIHLVTGVNVVGIANEDRAIVVDTRDCDPDNLDDPLLGALADFFTDDRFHKAYHHGAGYDIPVIDKIWDIPWDEMTPSYTDDSMFAHINLYPDEPHDLGHVTFEFVDAHAWKPPRTAHGVEVHEDFDELALYNARDVIHTARALKGLGVAHGKAIPGARMDRAGLSRVYEQDSRIRQIAIGMTMKGLPLDQEQWSQAGETAQGHIDHAVGNIRGALRDAGFRGWEDFNPNSTPQLRALMFGRDSFFKLPALSQTKTGELSTDKVTMQKLISTTKDENVLRFLQGKLELLQHNYVAKNFVFSPAMQPWPMDNRIHAIWKSWGARTGRFSSSPNLQNWPGWLKYCVVAPPGRKLVGADYDQLELRGIAWLSQDEGLIDKCLNAIDSRKLEPEHDPHSFVAQLAFGTGYTKLLLKDPKHDADNHRCKCQKCQRKSLRDIVKRVIYGMNYGAGDATVLAAIYDGGYEGPIITLDMIAAVRRAVFRAFPKLLKWRERQVQLAEATGELRSPLYDRRRIFPLGEVPVTECYNFPIQSLGADIMNAQLIVLAERLPQVDPSAFIIAQIHDAIYIEAAEDKAEAVAKLLQETLTVELERDGIVMPFTAASAISDNWKEAA